MSESTGFRRFLWPRSLAGKAGVISGALVVVLMAVFVAACHYSSKRLEEAWALSDELNLPNNLEALLGPAVPSKNNMAVPLDEASTIAQSHYSAIQRRTGIVDDHTRVTDPSYFAAFDELRRDAEYERLLSEAERRTEYRSVVVATSPGRFDLSLLHRRRTATYPELCLARHLLSKGECEEGLRRLLRIARLTRRWEDREPFLDGVLMNIAIRSRLLAEMNYLLRAAGPLPSSLHDEIDQEWAKCDGILRVVPAAVQSSKFVLMDTYADFSPFGGSAALRPFADHDRAYMLRYLHELALGALEPFAESLYRERVNNAALADVSENRVARMMHPGSVRMLPGNLFLLRQASDSLIAKARCLRIVNAWARRRDFALSLDQLGLPEECLTDPYDGQLLRIKRTPYGPVIYSVYRDQKDDGGTLWPSQGKWDVGLEPLELDPNRVQQP